MDFIHTLFCTIGRIIFINGLTYVIIKVDRNWSPMINIYHSVVVISLTTESSYSQNTSKMSYLLLTNVTYTNLSWTSYKCLTKFLQTSNKLLTDFLQTSYKLLTHFLQTSYKRLTNFLQTSYKLLTKFLQTSYKLLTNFLQTSY